MKPNELNYFQRTKHKIRYFCGYKQMYYFYYLFNIKIEINIINVNLCL